MKQFIWLLSGVFALGLLLGTLSACGANSFSPAVITTGQPSGEDPAPEEETPPEDTSREEFPAEDADAPPESASPEADGARRPAYGEVLWNAYLKGVLPGGETLDWSWNDLETASKNEFALADVDGDGEEELVLYWTTAAMAGMRGLVYGFDGGELRLELAEFPDLTFYENGAVTAGWSHNQGWAGRFWPYNLYRYDGGTGAYELMGAVDAWDRALFEDDETLRNAFPADVDKDGDGLVYYILTGEWYHNDRTPSGGTMDGSLWGTDPVDGADHEAWQQQYLNGSEIVDLPWQKLTEENIAALGAPKPEAAHPEPLG